MILVPRQVSTSFFIYKADITAVHRCMLSTDFKQPHCVGDACLPCYTAHMKRTYGHSMATHTKKLIRMWHRVLQSPQFPAVPLVPSSCAQQPEHGVQERAAILGNIKFLVTELNAMPQEVA